MNKLKLAAVIVLSFAGLSRAQVIEKKSLTMDGARRVIAASVAEAKKNHTTGVIAVVDDGGNLMALQRIDGTFAAGANISIGKARTAVLFQHPTKFFEDIINKGRTAMASLDGTLGFTPLQGGVPIVIDGQIVGGVGCSGAANAAQDEQLAMAGASALNGEMSLEPVRFFDKETVAAGFAKGSVLFDASDKYMVHASRRDGPGLVEIHDEDADLIYVLEGTATLLTGGKALNLKTVAPGEHRGTDLEGGETRHLVKGDVLVIPAGVPHWFKEVTAPFLYFVVKAR
jgi:uncharacterized protein GlcG (DUF336 family)/mannose-6-phosphate isomerase-like protein (cupin superfamily)